MEESMIVELHQDYLFKHSSEVSPYKRSKRKTLEGLVAEYLSIVSHHCYCLSVASVTGDIISISAKWKPDFSFVKAAQAFRAIEQYAVNLINITMDNQDFCLNSGHYKNRVDGALFGAEMMIMDMGFSPSPGQAQVLSLMKHQVNIRKVVDVARYCLFACVECNILAEIHGQVSAQFPISIEEVIDFRRDHIGSVNNCIQQLLGRKRVSKAINPNQNSQENPSQKVLDFLKKSIQMKDSDLERLGVQDKSTLHLISRLRGDGESVFSLDEKFLDLKYNFNFSKLKDDGKQYIRGGRKYIRPYGWNRVALNVKDKYEDTEWIGGLRGTNRTKGVDKEWPVTYHGTSDTFAKQIVSSGYDLNKGKRFQYGRGIYSTPDPAVAEDYATAFEFEGQKYKVMLQNRVNMEVTDVVVGKYYIRTGDSTSIKSGVYFITAYEKSVRPYGILYKKI